VVGHACGFSLVGVLDRRIAVQASLGKNARPHLKNNYSKKKLEVRLKLKSHLPSEQKAVCSNPRAHTKKKTPFI
jgi:hypothetical protein